jgi:dTMP kinase
LDVPADIGIKRAGSNLDRLESEPLAFHERVRNEFLNLANVDPERYAVIDATQSIEAIHEQIKERVQSLSLLKINNKDVKK